VFSPPFEEGAMAEGRDLSEGAAQQGTAAPAQLSGTAEGRQPSPGERMLAQVAFARAEALQVMAALDTDTDTLRNLLYRLAQVNVTLSAVLTEMIRVPVQDAPP
jgi:hypothetical protein